MRGKYQYGVVLDAGSSGTRIYVYRWLKSAVAKALATPEELHQLPTLGTKKKWTKKAHPGISTFAETPDRVGKDHLKELFEHALDIVPEEEIPNTPFFLLATAGMRLVPEIPRRELLAEVCDYVKRKTDFQITDCDTNIQVIPGETEGLYGWIASNYLVGAFSRPADHEHNKGHNTYGFLDMGGASAQIAFAPNVTEAEKHAEDLKLLRLRTVDGMESEYRVFVTTWLGYGANEARRRYVEALAASVDLSETAVLPDPCLPKGLHIAQDGTRITSELDGGTTATLIGTGRFSECLAQTYPLLDKDAVCDDPPCLFHGIHVPAIDFDINHFIGISEFWHSTHEIFEMGYPDKAFDFRTYQGRVTDFCSQDWSSIVHGIEDEEWGSKVDEQKAGEACFKASWIINMLHEGIGIPRVGIETSEEHAGEAHDTTKEVIEGAAQTGHLAPFQAMDKIGDVEVSWTLGKMILYASSLVPPANPNIQAVGFGSNIPGTSIPLDFQYAGGQPDMTSPSRIDFDDDDDDYDDDDDDDDDDSWTSKLLHGDDFSDRAPGLLLFAIILILVALLLCGKERRANILRKLNPFSRNNNKPTSSYSDHASTNFSLTPTTPRKLLASLGHRLGFSSKDKGPKYERVMEEGHADAIPRPDDFELTGMASSSEDDDARSLSSKGSSATRASRRVLGAAVESRAASLSRSGSREDFLGVDLAAVGTGHRSRTGSPTRRMTPLRERVD